MPAGTLAVSGTEAFAGPAGETTARGCSVITGAGRAGGAVFSVVRETGRTTGRAAGASGRTETGAGADGDAAFAKTSGLCGAVDGAAAARAGTGAASFFSSGAGPVPGRRITGGCPGREGAAIENSRSDDSARWAAASSRSA